MSDFEKLIVWRKSHALVLNVHNVAKKMRGRDYLSLRSQMLRAALSIPTNIVEGSAKNRGKEYARFLRIAIGSTTELEYHIVAARDLGTITRNDYEGLRRQTIEVRRMLYALTRHLESASS